MKKKLAILGVGSAGVLSLTHFCTWLDNSWDVISIHNPNKPILGIGESTNGGFVGLLERGLHFCLGHQADLDALDATLKFGSKFMKWREHSWINPLLDGNTAIHFNNFRFKEFAFERLGQLWPEKFRCIEGDIKEIRNYPDRVGVLVDDVEHEFDYVMDCMGFPQDFSGYTMSDCSPVNRCQIHHLMPGEYEFEPFTDHIATPDGWMFGVPLKSRKTYGYMYNDKITSKADAQKMMAELLNARLEDVDSNREYVFKCYYANEMISGRVGKNGNKALFFEPLIANSIFLYIYTARLFYDFVLGHAQGADCNRAFNKAVNEMEDVITYYYQGGSTYDTDFWKMAVPRSKQRLERRREFQDLMRTYGELKRQGILHHGPTYAFVPLTWEIVDLALGYEYVGGPRIQAPVTA